MRRLPRHSTSHPTLLMKPPKSLYRKYRPRSFGADDLFEQEHVSIHFGTLSLDRIAHAYLFCGLEVERPPARLLARR